MTAWKNLIGNSNLIVAETAKATLIKVPNTNFVFWHPSKLVRTSGKSGYRLSIGYTDDFEFNIFTPGKGKFNKSEKYNEQTILADEMQGYFE